MRDFTIQKYLALLTALQKGGYKHVSYAGLIQIDATDTKSAVLRHDVDAKKENSLAFAEIQYRMGICGTYYFRIIPASYNESVIRAIASMGHEIGYHYETMDTCNGNIDRAYDEFCRNLDKFRKIVPVSTVCMHGSPMSRYDNRAIWQKYNYRDLGIIAEPYFDLDFNKVFYLTDTGRRWDGASVSIRDKAMPGKEVTNPDFLRRKYHTTHNIISAVESGDFPEQVMFNFHPQRWTDSPVPWLQELALQSIKNVIKSFLVKHKN